MTNSPIRLRPDWHTYFMDIARLVATRSTCIRRQVGAVIVKENRILSTGYNGAPAGIVHCIDRGCLRDELDIPSGERHELCRGLHAEQNAIIQAAFHGVSINGGSIYCTNQPCIICAKMIINAGLKAIYITEAYADPLAREILAEAGIPLTIL
jgi:dCMP deaminase